MVEIVAQAYNLCAVFRLALGNLTRRTSPDDEEEYCLFRA